MNKQQIAYAKKIDDLREYVNGVQQTLYKLIRNCDHFIINFGDYESAVCDICGTSFGWYCRESPKKYCEYKAGDESCIHCGQPSERK